MALECRCQDGQDRLLRAVAEAEDWKQRGRSCVAPSGGPVFRCDQTRD